MATPLVPVSTLVNNVLGSEGSGTSGATLNGGKVVYIDTADDDKIKLADNTDQAKAVVAGIVLEATSSTGQPVVYQKDGEIDIGTTIVEGETYVLGANGLIIPAGDLLATEYMTVIGVGSDSVSTSILLSINDSGVQLATAGSTGDVSINHSNVEKVSGTSVQGTAGAQIRSGEVVYADSSASNKLKRGINTSVATAAALGLQLENTTRDLQPSIYVTTGSVIGMGATLTLGELYVLSVTGLISPVGDVSGSDYVTHIGVAITTSDLEVKIFASGQQRA